MSQSQSMPKSRGIIFQPEMILAYLARKKDQTRRVKGLKLINQDPDAWQLIFSPKSADIGFISFGHKTDRSRKVVHVKFPYGKVGDLLYFKETWRAWEDPDTGQDFIKYRADEMLISPVEFGWDQTMPDDWEHLVGRFDKWQSGMFMAQRFARFRDVKILSVKIERLFEITEEDARLEGVTCPPPKGIIHSASYRDEYFKLWDKINGKTLPASMNPWVWVYRFQSYDKTYVKASEA